MTTSPTSEARRYQNLRAHLGYLKLNDAADALNTVLDAARSDGLSLTAALERLLEIEVEATEARRLASRLRFACLPGPWTIGDFDFAAQPGVDEKLIRDLATLRFLDDANCSRRACLRATLSSGRLMRTLSGRRQSPRAARGAGAGRGRTRRFPRWCGRKKRRAGRGRPAGTARAARGSGWQVGSPGGVVEGAVDEVELDVGLPAASAACQLDALPEEGGDK